MKVYVDEYNSFGGCDGLPYGVGDYVNLIPWDLVKDTDWEAVSYTHLTLPTNREV